MNARRHIPRLTIAGRTGVRNSGRRGTAVVETALMAPFIFMLFLGVFDFGFYAYAAISTAHAARVVALYTSSSAASTTDSTNACLYAWNSLKDLPNVPGTAPTSCTALPVKVDLSTQTDTDDGSTISIVTVTYQTVPLFPLPGLMGQMTIARTSQMRVQS